MAKAQIVLGELGGGGGTPAIKYYTNFNSAGSQTPTFAESDYLICGVGDTTSNSMVLGKGESGTISYGSSPYDTSVQVTFAADGQSASIYKTGGYNYFSVFALKME